MSDQPLGGRPIAGKLLSGGALPGETLDGGGMQAALQQEGRPPLTDLGARS